MINLKTYCRMKILFSYWATISLTAVKWAKMKSKPTYYKGKRKLNTNTTTCLDFNQNILVVNHCTWASERRGARGRGTTPPTPYITSWWSNPFFFKKRKCLPLQILRPSNVLVLWLSGEVSCISMGILRKWRVRLWVDFFPKCRTYLNFIIKCRQKPDTNNKACYLIK